MRPGCEKTLNKCLESVALCFGYSLRNRLRKPGGAQPLQHGCDTTGPESEERGQRQNRPKCACEEHKPGESVPGRGTRDDERRYRVRSASASARRASLRLR